MLSLRHGLAATAFAVAALLPAAAGAQYYYTQPSEPPPRGFNRVVVTNAPIPPDLGRAYPYVANGQPGIVQIPQDRVSRRSHRAKFVSPKSRVQRAEQAALIEELKKRPRIKKVTIEDTTATVSPPVEAAAPRRKRVGLDPGERVIRAEAEVRILGNDQMSIRLYRKGQGPRAEAKD